MVVSEVANVDLIMMTCVVAIVIGNKDATPDTSLPAKQVFFFFYL